MRGRRMGGDERERERATVRWVVLSIFIDFRFSFCRVFFHVWETHFSNWFQLNFSHSPTHALVSRLSAPHRLLFSVCCCLLFLCYFPKKTNEVKKNCIQDDEGDMYRHYVAITIDNPGVRRSHVCLYHKPSTYGRTEWFVDRSPYTQVIN